jgi:hypothetical protein
MALLSYGNSKLKKDGIAAFSIPAVLTCPQADSCKKGGCYATQGFFNMPSVKAKYASNFLATKRNDFTKLVQADLIKLKPKTVRIHASGDFYNKDYFEKWVLIAGLNSSVKFYAYTKSVKMIKDAFWFYGRDWPKNLTIIFSEGGKQDHLINPEQDRHARVFPSLEALHAAGYADVTTHDIGAMGPNHKIGLVYHGAKSKAWSTND